MLVSGKKEDCSTGADEVSSGGLGIARVPPSFLWLSEGTGYGLEMGSGTTGLLEQA